MQYALSLAGGVLIGLSAWLLLWGNGRTLGVSGIVGGVFHSSAESKTWRFLFVAGVLVGGAVASIVAPEALHFSLVRSPILLVVAGLLVGFGTRLGNGCTSGHGVCGISRFSARSIVATMLFMGSGALVVYIFRHLLGGEA